jgi:hypothetical protein
VCVYTDSTWMIGTPTLVVPSPRRCVELIAQGVIYGNWSWVVQYAYSCPWASRELNFKICHWHEHRHRIGRPGIISDIAGTYGYQRNAKHGSRRLYRVLA